MEHLTKQQIVLLTLLVSFVTSLATGIFTVTLMDQGDIGITQVINRVVERTIEKAPPAPTTPAAAVVAINPVVAATDKVSESVVRFKPANGAADSVTGMGIIISAEGLVLTDKSALGDTTVAVLPDGKEVPIQIIQSDILGDSAFVVALISKGSTLTPVTQASGVPSSRVGDTVYALSGKQSAALETGILKKLPVGSEEVFDTSIPPKDLLAGSPLFDIKGTVMGFKTSSLKEGTSFFPLSALKSITPVLSR